MSDEAGAGRSGQWVEIAIAAVLSVAGLVTAWAGYQGSLWSGQQAANYSQAGALRVEASRAQLEADGQRVVEINLFTAWLQAKAKDDERLIAFYEARFPPSLDAAFHAWLALTPMKNPAAPKTPFSMPGYRPAGADRAKSLEAQANKIFDEGQRDNNISDLFNQAGVFLATAMFFGGIGQVFKQRPVRLALLVVAVIACAIGVARILSLPATRP